jgi:hypothetical protein
MEIPAQFRKPAGTPLVLEADVLAGPNLVRAERVALTMAKWTIRAAGALRTQGTGKAARRSFDGTVDVPPLPVRDLVALLAPRKLADGNIPSVRASARLAARGTVGQPASMHVEVPSFSLQGGKSDLTGKVALDNLQAPRLSFEGRSKYLDLDDFVPGKKAGKPAENKPAGGKGKPRDEAEQPPEMLRKVDGTVKLAVERGRAAEIDYRGLKADLAIKSGRLVARALDVDALGGHFSGTGSEFPLLDKDDPFVARGQITRLDVAAALARFADKSDLLAGRLDAKIDVTGKGTDPDLLKKTLGGLLTGSLADAQFLPVSLLEPIATTIAQAADKLPKGEAVRSLATKAAALKDRHLGTLGGALRFAGGAMELVKPLEARTPSGPLSIAGRVGLDGIADLTARLALSPQAASALTAGKLHFSDPLPVDLRVSGPISRPQVRLADAAALARVVGVAFARSAAGTALQEKATEVLEGAGAGKAKVEVDKAKEKAQEAEAEAARRAEEAKRVAAEQAEKAKQEAEARARAAKEAATRGLRGILGR